MRRRQFLAYTASAVVSAVVSRNACARDYPSRPIRMIVPTGAGGPQDVVARVIVERMRTFLGQAVIIENVPGATGSLGIGRVARAERDGYTIAFSVSSATHVVNAAVYDLPYDVVHDFEPVALVAATPSFIASRKDLPASNLRQLIAWLLANPDKASLGQTGPGSPAHVAGVLFQKLTGTRFQFVSYRGAGQAMQDLVAGHIDLMFIAPNISLEQLRARTITVYAVTAEDRLTSAPDIPTASEAGLPGFHTSNWYALWAPSGTAPEVIARLNAAVVDALADAHVRAHLADLALQVFPREQQTPEALRAFQKAEIEKWWPIIREAGIKVE